MFMVQNVRKHILCCTVFFIILSLSNSCYAQININPNFDIVKYPRYVLRYNLKILNAKGLYNYNSYVHKREMIFAFGWDTDYRFHFQKFWINFDVGYYTNLCHKYDYHRFPFIYDLSELVFKNNFNSVKNIWLPAPQFLYDATNFDECSMTNFFEFLVNSVVKDTLDYSQMNVLFDSDNKLTLSASRVSRNVHVRELRYNELYLFKCTVSYFSGPSTFICVPNLNVKYKHIIRDVEYKRYYEYFKMYWDDENHKRLFKNKFDVVMQNLIFTSVKSCLFKEQKLTINYIYDISEIEVFPVSGIEAYKKQIKSGLN